MVANQLKQILIPMTTHWVLFIIDDKSVVNYDNGNNQIVRWTGSEMIVDGNRCFLHIFNEAFFS